MTQDKNTFDPATHTFGMAYRDLEDDGTIVFGLKQDCVHKDCAKTFCERDGTGVTPMNMLIRAPEHDLVPRAPVTDEAKQHALRYFDKWSKGLVGGHDLVIEHGETIRAALQSDDTLKEAILFEQSRYVDLSQNTKELVEVLERQKSRFEFMVDYHPMTCSAGIADCDAALAKHRKNGE
jgi:hypothetical protein